MRKNQFLGMMLTFALGCTSSPPESDPMIPIEQVPANVMDVAREQLPGYTFDTAYKMKMKGKTPMRCGARTSGERSERWRYRPREKCSRSNDRFQQSYMDMMAPMENSRATKVGVNEIDSRLEWRAAFDFLETLFEDHREHLQ